MDVQSRRRSFLLGMVTAAVGLAGCGRRMDTSMLALGDSYTVGTGVQTEHRWLDRLVDRLCADGVRFEDLVVVAQNGWTTEDLDAALSGRNLLAEYDLVTLCIGANDAFHGRNTEAFYSRFRALLETAVDFAAGGPAGVLVLSIPDYTVTPVGQRHDPKAHRSRLDGFNERIEMGATDRGIRVVDLVEPSRKAAENPDLVAKDGLHPSSEQHELWLNRIEPAVREIL